MNTCVCVPGRCPDGCARHCGRRWTSVTECHCAACHRHFRTLTGFDTHRVDGECADPMEHGLIEAMGTWATPEGHEAAQRSRQMLESARKRRRKPRGGEQS